MLQKFTDVACTGLFSGELPMFQKWLKAIHNRKLTHRNNQQIRVQVVDQLENTDLLTSRAGTGRFVQQFSRNLGLNIRWPVFMEPALEAGKRVRLPVIVKPVDACASPDSHSMVLVTSAG